MLPVISCQPKEGLYVETATGVLASTDITVSIKTMMDELVSYRKTRQLPGTTRGSGCCHPPTRATRLVLGAELCSTRHLSGD